MYILVPDPPPLTQIGHGVERIRSHVRDHPPGNGHHIPELAQVAADGYPQSTTATTTEPGAACGAWSSLRTLWANLSLPEVAQTLPSSPNLGLFLLRLPNSIANPFRIRPSRLQCLFDSATTDRTASFCHRMPRRDEP